MHLHISHETVYTYDAPLNRSTQYLRLTPRPAPGVRVLSWHLQLPASASICKDAFGNTMHVLSLDGPRGEIHLRAIGEVITDDAPPHPDPTDELPAPLFLRDSPLTRADASLRSFAAGFAEAAAQDAHAALMALMQAVGDRMPYVQGFTDAATPAAQAFSSGYGVCQDHAQVFACCARLLGLPARYVSGYLATDAAHVASHAWAEVRLPAGGASFPDAPAGGWLGYDVSNQCLADARHVKLAIGADYLDACPVRGVRTGGGMETMRAEVLVKPGTGLQQ
ncbi:transglutaminase family protein [Roseateles amylovorans]|jgi:transglutaminase-like putative cysteine protease|uniref:Transglutaminase family protein n=1 Tax=Roseateles amylovorans TaxID=2978473 RepID=A0ABY6B503_9BURK|nr:transglutaminase family protein [Roseateles amylovorans]UXH78633.1 transglutaminase family protein [Roseateles amylovorans]